MSAGRREEGKMKCKAFEKLTARQPDGGTQGLPVEALAHLAGCAACRDFFAGLQASFGQDLPSELAVGLRDSVLACTSGPACQRAGTLLCGFVDGELDPLERELVAGHLDFCPACAQLADALAGLRDALPRLAELSPPDDLAGAVCDSVRRLRARQVGFFARIQAFFSGLLDRPRFSWEAAYLGTLVICAIFGAPFSPVREAGPRLIASLTAEQGLVNQSRQKVVEWSDQLDLTGRALTKAKGAGLKLYDWTARAEEVVVSESSRHASQLKGTVSSVVVSVRATAGDIVGKLNQDNRGPAPSHQ